MQIRRMMQDDLIQVCEIENKTFSDPWSEKSFADSMNKQENIYLVVDEDGQISGYCGLWGVAGEGQICNVAVRETARNRGIAKAMLKEMMRLGDEAGLTAYTLEVRVSNAPAIKVYHSLGFENAGVRKNFYTKPQEDALIMWK